MTELYADVTELGRLFVNKENEGNLCLQVIFRSYFFAGFFFFPLVLLGTDLASDSDFVDVLFKFVSVKNGTLISDG